MTFALDLDAVCTDTRHLAEISPAAFHSELANTTRIDISPREGVFQLASALRLFGRLEVVTSLPPIHKAAVEQWLSGSLLGPLVDRVTFCDDEVKATLMHRRPWHIYIDGFEKHAAPVAGTGQRLLWGDQTWDELLPNILNLAARRGRCRPTARPDFVLEKAEPISDWGSSPAFLLIGEKNLRLKLRVFRDPVSFSRVARFDQLVSQAGYKHIPSRVDACGVAVLREFVPGVLVATLAGADRGKAIGMIGRALASLHGLVVEPKQKVHAESMISLLIYGADDHNTIVAPNGSVYFVDLEACSVGTRWSDLSWSWDHLCRSSQERRAVTMAYLSAFGGAFPPRAGWEAAVQAAREWLCIQLEQSATYHPTKAEIYVELEATRRRLRIQPPVPKIFRITDIPQRQWLML